jgi:nicotinamide riboside kinase
MKIAFTGPESCGKSTMATWFASAFQLSLSEEFARTYLATRSSYEQLDLDRICEGQLEHWKSLGNTFVADTEMTVLKVWSNYRYKEVSPLISQAYSEQLFDHYFLCAPDIPWEADPLRENATNRDEIFDLYLHELNDLNRPFTILYGSVSERQKVCESVWKSLVNA